MGTGGAVVLREKTKQGGGDVINMIILTIYHTNNKMHVCGYVVE